MAGDGRRHSAAVIWLTAGHRFGKSVTKGRTNSDWRLWLIDRIEDGPKGWGGGGMGGGGFG